MDSRPNAADIIDVEITEDGIGRTITRGSEAARFIARMCVAFLRELRHDPVEGDEAGDLYAHYRALKHASGPDSATPASRLVAHEFAMRTAIGLANQYLSESL